MIHTKMFSSDWYGERELDNLHQELYSAHKHWNLEKKEQHTPYFTVEEKAVQIQIITKEIIVNKGMGDECSIPFYKGFLTVSWKHPE